MWKRNLLFISLVLFGVAALRASLFPLSAARSNRLEPQSEAQANDLSDVVAQANAAFAADWTARGLHPAAPAAPLTVVRRLSVALSGTIPSLEELRQLERLPPEQQVSSWVSHLLRDRRYADYFAERLARTYVGTEDGPFLVYRRRRFVTWLSDQVLQNRSYGDLVGELISSRGLWTDQPATNFITVTMDKGRPDPERLGARVARAFLGLRLDCAQCHDHKFDERWKQKDFHSLAAFFAPTKQSFTGIYDGKGEHHMEDAKTGAKHLVEPAVPFDAELLQADETQRASLARWITRAEWVERPHHPDPEKLKEFEGYQAHFARHHPPDLVRQQPADRVFVYNVHFARATVQRVWALLFNRPLLEAVESMEALEKPPLALVLLAYDFARHNYDLQRLIRVIAASQVFQLDSASPLDSAASAILAGGLGLGVMRDTTEAQAAHWAVFPISRLRPEQIVGSVQQAAAVRTIDAESPLLTRLAFYTGEKEFVRRYGDTGEDEFAGRGGTIPQRLLLMNGNLVKEKTKDDLFNAANLIAGMAPDDRAAVETAYLAILTRRPTAEEADYFEKRLAGAKGKQRAARLEDLYWTLINSTEFSWNH